MPPTLVDEYTELRTKALAITDAAAGENRQLTDDEHKTLAETVEQAKAKHDEIEKQKTAGVLIERARGLHAIEQEATKDDHAAGPKGEKVDRRSFGERFIDSPSFKSLKDAYPNGVPDSADPHMPPVLLGSARGSKALVYVGDNATQAGSTVPGVPPDFRGFIPPYFYQLSLFDVLTRSSTSSDLVEYVREDLTARTNAAAPVPEAKGTTGAGYTAAAKPESAVAWIRVATAVKTIATWIPVTNKALADVPQIRDMIDAYLIRFLNEALADQIVNGDGTGENLDGMLAQIPSFTPTGDGFVGLREAQAEAELNGTPNAWLMNPADVASVDTQVDGMNRFYGGGPFASGPRTLWGLPIVTVRQVPAGTALVGDFNQCILYDREAASVQVGTINDQFTHNLRTLLAEERSAFGILRPSALVQADFTFPTFPTTP